MFTRPDRAAVLAALAGVEDPELHEPLTELGMVADVAVERAGRVCVSLLLTIADCPLRERLSADVTRAVREVPGVADVRVSFGVMGDAQRMAIAQRLRSRGSFGALPQQGPPVYAVASGKGGVGKSSVTANLAAALAQRGRRVGILDADVWGYSIPQLFGVRRAPVALKGLMLPVEAYGVALMSVGFFVDENEPVVWRGPMLHKALEQFFRDVYWGELDALFIDLPPGTGDVTISLLELCPEARLLVVTTPQQAAHRVAARVGHMARDMGMAVAGVVENMSELVCGACGGHTSLFGSGGGALLADSLGVSLLGQIPLDPALRAAGDLGVPVVVHAPGSESAGELERLAVSLGSLPAPRRSLVGVALPLAVV